MGHMTCVVPFVELRMGHMPYVVPFVELWTGHMPYVVPFLEFYAIENVPGQDDYLCSLLLRYTLTLPSPFIIDEA